MGELRLDYSESKAVMREISNNLNLLYDEKEGVQSVINELQRLVYSYSKANQTIDELNIIKSKIQNDIYKLEGFSVRLQSFVDKVKETDEALGKKFKEQVSTYCRQNNIEESSWFGKLLDVVQVALDVIGLIPGLGEIADLVNGLISLARGNYFDALLSFLAMIPLAGDAFKSLKYLDEAGALLKYGDEVLGMGKAFLKETGQKVAKVAKKAFVKMDPKNIKNVLKESIDLGGGSFYVKLKNGVEFGVNKTKDGLSTLTCDVLGIYCFSGETLVSTSSGLKEIRDIKIGEIVLTKNQKSNIKEYKKVEEVHVGTTYELCTLKVENGIIETTTGHLFMTKDRWWQAAVNLTLEDEVETSDGRFLKVIEVNVEKLEYPKRIYNLSIEDNSNYYVSDSGILVHNTLKCEVVKTSYVKLYFENLYKYF